MYVSAKIMDYADFMTDSASVNLAGLDHTAQKVSYLVECISISIIDYII